MKTRFKHLSKSTISIILAVMMVVSTFTVSIVATNAALSEGEMVGSFTRWENGTVIYIDTHNVSGYDDDFHVQTYYDNESVSRTDATLTTVDAENHIYSITTQNDEAGIETYRGTLGSSTNNWSGKKGRDGNKNCLVINGWDNNSSWSTYTPTTPETVNYGVHSSGNGTLAVSPATSTGASGGTINSGTSVTFTASPSPGYTVAGWYSNSACTTAISGASGTTYTTTISGTTNVYVKFAEATWPPFNFTNSDSNKLRYAHSTDHNDIRNEKCSYWDNELKTDGNGHWWIDVTANINDFVTDLANSPYKKLYFRLQNSSGETWYNDISITTTNSPGVSASTGSTNQDNTTYKYAAITGIQSGYTVNHIGAYMYVEDNTLHVDFYSDGTNATNNKVYFKGLGNTWSGTGPEGTQVEDTAEYTYVVQQSDIFKGSKGEAFYFRVLYKGEEYAPTGSTDVLLTENTQVTTTNKDTNGAFYFPGANVGATIHASLSGSTLTVWYTSAHTYNNPPEYYVVGRFKVKDGSTSGQEYYTKNGEDGAWSSTLTESKDKFKFNLDSTTTSGTDTIYTYHLNTNETLGELSPFVWENETRQTPYVFAVYDRNYHFGESSNSGKGKAFINYRADTSALSLEKYANLTENNEMQFEDPDNSNGTVVLHLKVIGTPGEGGTIDLGTAKYSIWYTIDGAKPYAVDVAKLTASPSAVAQGGKIKLTASYTGAQSIPENLRYTFQKLNPTTFKYETISGNDPLLTNVFEYEETTVGTNEYRVLISSVTQEGTADKYYPRAATTQASCYVAGLYMSNNIATIPDNTTWDSTDMKSTSFRKVTTAPSYTNSNPYEFAFSTINGSFDVNAPLFALDPDGNNQNCKIEYSTQVVTIDGVEKAVRTYKVIPNTKCSDPIIYLDITNKKLYATCTYNGATEEKTSDYDSTEFVTYYFAEQVGHENDTNASTNAHQSAAGTGNGMRIRYWNASVQEGGANDYMGETDVYEQATVRKSDGTYTSNTIYVNMDQLYAIHTTGNKQFYVYKVKLPVRATSFSFLNSSGSPIKGGFLNSVDFASTVASNTLNPNRIYLYYWGDGQSNYNSDDYISFKGIILDDHLWTANNSGSATNQVSTKNVDATLINYTDIGTDPRVDLGNKEVNQAALSAYTAAGTPHALYFGDFTKYGTLTGYSNYVHWKNVAQHANDKSYFAIVKDLVGMTLSKTQMNANGYPMLLDTQGNNSDTGLSNAQLMPLFDYNTVATARSNSKKIASMVEQQLNFPMNRSTYNGITTYSYDSTTDWNRIWDGTNAKDFVIQGDEETHTGYRHHYAYGKDGKGLADTGFFPFGGNNDQATGTGFGTEFDLKFYMTNTGYLTQSDGTTNEDIAFNFSGDDDVWVYVDGVKVLDLGGAHKTAAASINFTDMKVYYKVAGNSANGSGITSTTDGWASENDYVKTVDLKELLSAYGQEFDPKDATKQHTLQMFYMERGAYESNCSLSYNLPQASGLSIKNNVTADNVNIALKTAALYAAVPDYFTYQLSAKEVDSNTHVITGTPAPNTRGDLSNNLPQYQYNYETYYTYKDGVHSDIQYKLSKAHSGTTTGGSLPTYSASNYTNAGNVVYALSGNVTATTEGKAFPTGQTDADGTFYLLNNQMANFDSKVPANSYVKIAQKQALGKADTGAANTDREGLLVYGSVPNNNVGNYYLTSYSIYDEKAKKYIAGAENSPVELPLKYGDNDDYYAADTDNNLSETGAFYFSNYSGSTDDLNSAMKVDFYNDIAVGDIRIEKQLAENATSNSFFIFDIEFRDIFGDDTDSDWNKYDGLEYWVYNENGDLAYPSAQYYTARTGIQLRAGEYALIKGIPVESRYRISERSTVGFSFNKYDLKTYMNDGNTEVDVDYNGTQYKFSDSSTTSSTTDSDTILYTENEDGHAYNYYKTMIPTVSQSQDTPGDRTKYGATAKIVYTNAKENISIVFKYYDRDVTNNKPASIKESPTEYSYKFDNLEKYTYYKAINDSKIADVMADPNQTTYSQEQVTAYNNIEVGGFVCIDFEAILKENAIIFEGDVQLQNLIDNYYMWTTQAAALAAMQTKPNLHADNEGATNYTAAEAVYHTKSDGTPNSAGEKWVTYYNGKAQAVDAENFTFADQTDYDSVRSIVVWLYNVPQSYDVKVYGVKDTGNGFNATNYVHAATNPKVRDAYVANNNGYYQENATTAYYSQRVGRPLNDPDYLDALAYMKAYNFSGIVPNFIPKNMTDESITINPGASDEQTLQFAYWSYNSDGSTVASTEWSYGYRITNNVNLYAVYAPAKMDTATRGLTITQDKDDNYVDADPTTHAGVARTRLNVMFTPYNCPDYDTNIKYAGLVNIYVTNLVKQLRDQNETDEQIEETIKGLQAKYADDLKLYLATYLAFSQTLYYNDITPTITLTAKGYVYNALGTGSPSVQLTNKNRVEFTTDFKTSALYPAESHANHNCVGILQIGAMCYDDDGTPATTDWILSDNCIVRLFKDED